MSFTKNERIRVKKDGKWISGKVLSPSYFYHGTEHLAVLLDSPKESLRSSAELQFFFDANEQITAEINDNINRLLLIRISHIIDGSITIISTTNSTIELPSRTIRPEVRNVANVLEISTERAEHVLKQFGGVNNCVDQAITTYFELSEARKVTLFRGIAGDRYDSTSDMKSTSTSNSKQSPSGQFTPTTTKSSTATTTNSNATTANSTPTSRIVVYTLLTYTPLHFLYRSVFGHSPSTALIVTSVVGAALLELIYNSSTRAGAASTSITVPPAVVRESTTQSERNTTTNHIPTECEVCVSATSTGRVVALTACNHGVCTSCMSAHLRANRRPREDPTAAHHPSSFHTQYTDSLFEFAPLPPLPVPGDYVSAEHSPTMCTIRCLVANCTHNITTNDISTLPEYQSDLKQSVTEFEKHVSDMCFYRQCALSDLLCGENVQPVSQLMQLGCDHFMHAVCIAAVLKNNIKTARTRFKDSSAIVCPVCVERKVGCGCFSCSLIADVCASDSAKNGSGKSSSSSTKSVPSTQTTTPLKPHIVTEAEIRALVTDPECDFTAADHEAWLEASLRSGVKRVQSSANQPNSNNNNSNTAGDKLMHCDCGNVFYVSAVWWSSNVVCPNPTCKKTLCTKVSNYLTVYVLVVHLL